MAGGIVVKYYYAGDRRVAMCIGGVTYYLFPDHLGSTHVIDTGGGSPTSKLLYKPWGETRDTYGTPITTWRFTGQREDATIGLYFYGARYCDSALGRFTQPDTIVPNPGDPQSLNRYSYAANNSLRFSDPTGHAQQVMGGGVETGMAVAAGYALASQAGQALNVWVADAQMFFQQFGNLLPAMGDQIANPGQASRGASSNAGNTAGPGGLDPNDPNFNKAVEHAVEQVEDATCPGCKTENPQLLRSRGAIAARQQVELAHVGEDGISVWCTNCTSNAGKFWGRSIDELQTFARDIGLDPQRAAVYTPQFGGEGHWSLFIDAIGPDGYLLPQYADLIDAFLRAGIPITR